MNGIELLAPAGDLGCVETALYFGADAVYFGGPGFQLRAPKVGFSMEDVGKAVRLVHEKGKKAYVTVNAFARTDELEAIGEYAKALDALGV